MPSLYLGKSKKSHFQHYYSYTSDYLHYLRRKQTATVVLQLSLFTYCCFVLPIICIALVLHLGHTTGGVRVLIWTCWDLQQRLVATWGWISTDLYQKRLEACTNAEGGHSEHLLWHCLPDIPVATHHNWLLRSHRRQPTTGSLQSLRRLKECHKPSVRWKSFAIHKLV